MFRWIFCMSLVGLFLPGAAFASDPVGVYAVVESVTLVPDAKNPETVLIAGAFSVSRGKRGGAYSAPRWGVLHCRIVKGSEDKCRREWADLKRVAGKGECVAFGARYRKGTLRLWSPGEKPGAPDLYPLGYGVQRARHSEYFPTRHLLTLPKPVGPLATQEVEVSARGGVQALTLTIRNGLKKGKNTRYLFEVETSDGEIVSSKPIEPGEKETSYHVGVQLTAGETFTWRVRVLEPDLDRVPVVATKVRAKAAPKKKS